MIIAVAEDDAGVSFPQQQTATHHHHKERQTCWSVLCLDSDLSQTAVSCRIEILPSFILRVAFVNITFSSNPLGRKTPHFIISSPGQQTEDDILSQRLVWAFESEEFASAD